MIKRFGLCMYSYFALGWSMSIQRAVHARSNTLTFARPRRRPQRYTRRYTRRLAFSSRRFLLVQSLSRVSLMTLQKMASSSMASPSTGTTSELAFSTASVCAEEYLHEVSESLDPEFTLTITEQHRKSLVRGASGLPKVEFSKQLRELQSERLWNNTVEFCSEHMLSLPHTFPSEIMQKAPQLTQGLATMETFRDRPTKFFSFLARGREYQGQFIRLLEDLDPDLLPSFEECVREPTDKELLLTFIDKRIQDDEAKMLLQDFMVAKLPNGTDRRKIDGKTRGQLGERGLKEFLEERVSEMAKALAATIATATSTTQTDAGENRDDLVVADTVYVAPRRHRPPKTNCIELSSKTLPTKMTNEFDTLVLQKCDGGVRILEMWEAKMTLSPVTINDAVSKKYAAMRQILEDDNARVWLDGVAHPLIVSSDERLRIGIYGNRLMKPADGGCLLQTVICERIMQRVPDAALRAVQRGFIPCPIDDAKTRVSILIDSVQKIEPLVFVPRREG